MMKTQNQKIKEFLSPPGRSLTAMKALRLFGTFRLASRVNQLRGQGVPIRSEMVKVNGKYVAKYFMA